MFKLLKNYTKDGWWAAILGPIFTILEVIFDALIPLTMTDIIDTGIYAMGGDMNYILNKGINMVLLALGAAVCGALSGLFSSISSCRFVRNIRNAIFRKIQTWSFENIEKYPVPTVVMRLTTDMRMMRMAYVAIVRTLVRAPFNLIISFYYVYKLNNRLAAIFAIAGPILATGLIFLYSKAHPRFRKLFFKFDEMNAKLEENVEGIRVVKTFVRENYENDRFEKSSTEFRDSQRYAENVVFIDRPFFEFIMYAVMILISWFGGKDIVMGKMTTGEFMAYLAYVRAILFALLMIADVFMQVVMSQSCVD